jgi:DNA-binding transcriptional MerR regulator
MIKIKFRARFLILMLTVFVTVSLIEAQRLKSNLRQFNIKGLKEVVEMRKAQEEKQREYAQLTQRVNEKRKEMDEENRRSIFRKVLNIMGGVQASRFL